MLDGFDQKLRLQLFQFLGFVLGQIFGLAEVPRHVVKLPREVVRVRLGSRHHPRWPQRAGAGYPAVVIEAAVGSNLKILRGVPRRRFRGVKRVAHAHAFDWHLLNAVEHERRLNTDRFEDRWDDIDDMMKLRAQLTGALNT